MLEVDAGYYLSTSTTTSNERNRHQFIVIRGSDAEQIAAQFEEQLDRAKGGKRKLILNKVLLVGTSSQTMIGRPIVPDAAVHAVVEKHAAVAAKSSIVQEFTEIPSVPVVKEEQQKPAGKRNPPTFPLGMIVKVKPQAKKAKIDQGGIEEATSTAKTSYVDTDKTLGVTKTPEADTDKSSVVSKTGLVSYSDDSEDDL